MAISRLTLTQRFTTFLVCIAVMPISIAGYVYTWNTISATDFDISGSIEFADTIEFGDAVTDHSEIVAFDYSIVYSEDDSSYGASFGIDDVYFEGAILVERAGLGSGKRAKKKAKKKAVATTAVVEEKKKATKKVAYLPGPISLDGDDGYIYFDVGSDFSWLISEGAVALRDLMPDLEPINGEEGKVKKKAAKKKAARKALVTGIMGEWSAVGLPEPSSFMLLLAGFFMVGSLVRRRFSLT